MKTNSIRKIISALCILTLVFTLAFEPFSVAFAAQPETSTDARCDGAVAEISVCSRLKTFGFGNGHMWIYVNNISDETLTVGHYELPAGEGVSIALFSVSCSDGGGIYYNVEAYCDNVYNNKGSLSITEKITESDLGRLNKKLVNYLNHWDPVFNCMYFAFSMWNCATDRPLIYLMIPILGYVEMFVCGGKLNVLDMFCPEAEKVFRQRGNGKNAYLEPVSAASIDQAIAA